MAGVPIVCVHLAREGYDFEGASAFVSSGEAMRQAMERETPGSVATLASYGFDDLERAAALLRAHVCDSISLVVNFHDASSRVLEAMKEDLREKVDLAIASRQVACELVTAEPKILPSPVRSLA